MKSVKKTVRYILLLFLAAGIVFFSFLILNPFAWGMRSSLPEQPKWSEKEKRVKQYFKEQGLTMERRYYNLDPEGWTTHDPIDLQLPFVYEMSLTTFDKDYPLDTTLTHHLRIAHYMKDSILDCRDNLKGIYLFLEYRDQRDRSGRARYRIDFEFRTDPMTGKLLPVSAGPPIETLLR